MSYWRLKVAAPKLKSAVLQVGEASTMTFSRKTLSIVIKIGISMDFSISEMQADWNNTHIIMAWTGWLQYRDSWAWHLTMAVSVGATDDWTSPVPRGADRKGVRYAVTDSPAWKKRVEGSVIH